MMKTIIIPVFLSLFTFSAFSQNDKNTVDSLYKEGFGLFKQQKPEKSAEVLMAARQLFTEKGLTDSVLLGNILHYLGTDYLAMEKNKEAKVLLLEALGIRQRNINPCVDECAKTLNNLAITAMSLAQFSEGEQYALRALALKESGPAGRQTLEYANSQNTLAQIFIRQGRLPAADSLWQDQLERRRAILKGDNFDPVANSLNALAGVRALQFRYEAADSLYNMAAEIMRSLHGEESFQYMSVYLNFGQLYARIGMHEKAEETQRNCVRFSERIKGENSTEFALALYNLGFVLQQQGRFKEAMPILQEAYERTNAIFTAEHPETLRILSNIASGYYYLNDVDRALLTLKQIVEAIEKSEFRGLEYYEAMLNYGVALTENGQFQAAEKQLQGAMAAAKSLGLSERRLNALYYSLGRLYLDWGKLDVAESWLLKARNIVVAGPRLLSPLEVPTCFYLSRVYQEKDDFENALKYMLEGKALMEKYISEASKYLSTNELQQVADLCFSLTDLEFQLLSKWNKPEVSALSYDQVLFNKGYVLDIMEKERRQFEKDARLKNGKWAELGVLRQKLAVEISKIAPDEALLASYYDAINALEKDISQNRNTEVQLRWQQVQDALTKNEASIEFVANANNAGVVSYWALILRKDEKGPVAVRLCSGSALAMLFDTNGYLPTVYYGKITDPRLYDLIVAPLLPHLTGIRKIWVTPDGLLNRINISAIGITGDSMLADRFELVLLESTRQVVNRVSNHAVAVPHTALVASNINYGKSQNPADEWNYLSAAKYEGKTVDGLLNASGCKTVSLTDTLASEYQLRKICAAASLEAIHLATHADYLGEKMATRFKNLVGLPGLSMPVLAQNPMNKVGIVLAGANYAKLPGRARSDDGILTAYELSMLDLTGNQLLVVSGCESGLGDIDAHEGVWGIHRACRLAGGDKTMLCLWEINDNLASDFMNEFYLKWMTTQDVHAAFYAAQQTRRKFNPDPRYWAGYVLHE